jgi:histidinol-phosphatase (PHP family)
MSTFTERKLIMAILSDYNITTNFHTHTTRCGHASGEDREYVEAAIKAGIKHLGFSDHSPYPTNKDFVSGMRIKLNETDGYFDSIMSLRKEYANDICIYAGVEAEYFPEHFEKLCDFLKDYPLDYMILGNHFVDDEQHGFYLGSPFTDVEPVNKYTKNVITAIKSGKFAYVAHPDLPNYVGEDSDEVLSKSLYEICNVAKEHNTPLEVNVLGYTRHAQYPSERFLKIAKEVGNDVILGIDAHSPIAFSHIEPATGCLDLIKKYNLNRIDIPPMLCK